MTNTPTTAHPPHAEPISAKQPSPTVVHPPCGRANSTKQSSPTQIHSPRSGANSAKQTVPTLIHAPSGGVKPAKQISPALIHSPSGGVKPAKQISPALIHSPSGGVKSAKQIWWGRIFPPTKILTIALATTLIFTQANPTQAQGFERWFQIELTIFSNESSPDRERENWQAGTQELAWPENMVRLIHPVEFLMLESFTTETENGANDAGSNTDSDSAANPDLSRLRNTGPFPLLEASGFRFPDLQREPFIALPASLSDFRQTNQALERSPQYRILYHGLWRQPVGDVGTARPILVAGGGDFPPHRELQGSVALEFNANRDRVVLFAELWFTEFGGDGGDGGDGDIAWKLPGLPEELTGNDTLADAPAIRRIYTLRQQRELRSGEFHYLDHPAFGVVAQIRPWDVPPEFVYPEADC